MVYVASQSVEYAAHLNDVIGIDYYFRARKKRQL